MASSLTSALLTMLIGVALILEGPVLVAPIAVTLAPRLGSAQALQVDPGSEVSSNQFLNAGDRFISEIVVQGGNVTLIIEGPGGTLKNETSLAQEYVLDYRAPVTGAYSIVVHSRSSDRTYLFTRTVIIRSIFGFDATLVVGAVLAIPPVPFVLRRLGYIGLFSRKGLISPRKIRRIVPDQQAVVVSAPACDEYETMANNFLEDSLKSGNSVLYVSLKTGRIEDLSKRYPGRVYALTGDLKAQEKLPNAAALETFSGVGDLTGIDIATTQLLNRVDVSHGAVAYLDIMSDVLLSHSLPLARKWLTQMLGKLKGKGLTVLANVNPTMVATEKVEGATDLFDAHLEITETVDRQGTKRCLQWIRRPHSHR